VAIVTLAVAWALCLGIGFERLVTLDILLYGGSLLLEFVALAALRFTAPGLPRPFRVAGGKPGAIAVGIAPMLLLGFAVVRSGHEHVAGMNALVFGVLIILGGFFVYFIRTTLGRRFSPAAPQATEEIAAE
jgi:amino acid transporter